MATVMINRDPFARLELHRETEYACGRGCTWCGQKRPSGNLFRYSVQTDGGRSYADRHLFCSKPCRDSYYG